MRHAQVAALAPPMLAGLAAELDHAGELCARLEELVSRLVVAVDGKPKQLALSEAQTLDVLTQHLAGLSIFTRGLSHQIATARNVDPDAVLAAVPLSDLAARLRTCLYDAALAPPPKDEGSGELDLF
ncbi:MAG TPA: hypothetical protein PKA17_06935 [Phenylobacterium sp.]|nr:hypothetical protein [Phenylobacterium sp.]